MRVLYLLSLLSIAGAVDGSAHDRFNYDKTDLENRNFGPADWDKVVCNDLETCPGWPTNWEDFDAFVPADGMQNMCEDCTSLDNTDCRRNTQSPINLERNATARRKCKDKHRMNFVTGNCNVGQLDFEILPHVLRAYQPHGCGSWPNIDFSRGFPDPWHLAFTDISVPSQHVQGGKRYDAEVVLSHVYSEDKDDKLIGNVAIFLEAGDETDWYDFLDLYTRYWLKAERKIRRACKKRNQTSILLGDQSRRRGSETGAGDLPELTVRQTAGGSPQVVKRRYFNREYQPYDWYAKTGTEYYFRYEGSMTEPPCFSTVHWRVIKDPIRVAPMQIKKLDRLLARRLNPETCEKESAGKPRYREGPTRRDVNRPLQATSSQHKLVFCECETWESKKPADQEYCLLSPAERGVEELSEDFQN